MFYYFKNILKSSTSSSSYVVVKSSDDFDDNYHSDTLSYDAYYYEYKDRLGPVLDPNNNNNKRFLEQVLFEDYDFVNRETLRRQYNNVDDVKLESAKPLIERLRIYDTADDAKTFVQIYLNSILKTFDNEYQYLSIIKQLVAHKRDNFKQHVTYNMPAEQSIRFDLHESRVIFISTLLPTAVSNCQFTSIVADLCGRILLDDSVKYIIRSCIDGFRLQLKRHENNNDRNFRFEFKTGRNVIKQQHPSSARDTLILHVLFERADGNADDDTRQNSIKINNRYSGNIFTIRNDVETQKRITYRLCGMMKRRVVDIHESVCLDLLYGSIIIQTVAHELNLQADYLFYGTEQFKLNARLVEYYYKLLFHRSIRKDRRVTFI